MIDAYILKTLDYKDTSKIIYFLTDEGIKSAIARGVKKMQSPLRHLMQAGMLVSLDLSKGDFPTVKDATMKTYFKAIKEDLVKTTILSVINELIYYNLTEHDDHHKLFAFVEKVLHALNTSDSPREILMVFELKFLYYLGYGINFNHCAVCKTTDDLVFDVHQSMCLCETHKDLTHDTLNARSFAPLKYYLHCDITQFESQHLPPETLRYLDTVISSLYDTHLNARPKAKTILKTIN
ncbi:MAG: DNA repair protein RecO [Bacillota bacterium]